MSIFYNHAPSWTLRIPSMNRSLTCKLVLLLGAFAVASFGASTETPTPTSASTLAPIAFLTAHEWDAKLPDSKDGKKMKIHAVFTWAPSRQAIRISNQFVTDGKAAP